MNRTTILAAIVVLAVTTIDGQAPLEYLGAFRVPADFADAGKPIAFNPAHQSLYLGKGKLAAEISIPAPGPGSTVDLLPRARVIQDFFEPIALADGWELGGLTVDGDRLIGSAYIYYDAMNLQTVTHFVDGAWSRVWDVKKAGFVSGYMAPIPQEHQSALGGNLLTGNCCLPIITRTSYGPAAFAVDVKQIGQPVVSATPLLYYDAAHPTLGGWATSSPVYGSTTEITGVAIIGEDVWFVGSNGLGPYCYGTGEDCHDPTSIYKGVHGYPYRSQLWKYRVSDLAAVKAGTKQPWEITPEIVPLDLPFAHPAAKIGGMALDPAHGVLYISQLRGDDNLPVIHAFRVSSAAQTGATIAALEQRLSALETMMQEVAAALLKMLKPK